MTYLIVAVVAVVVAIFAMQNTTAVTVKFLVWRLSDVPVSALVLVSLGLGIIVAGVPLWFQLWRARNRLRAAAGGTPATGGAAGRPAQPPD